MRFNNILVMKEEGVKIIAQGSLEFQDQNISYKISELERQLIIDVAFVRSGKLNDVNNFQFVFNEKDRGIFSLDDKTSRVDVIFDNSQEDFSVLKVPNFPFLGEISLRLNNGTKELSVFKGEDEVIILTKSGCADENGNIHVDKMTEEIRKRGGFRNGIALKMVTSLKEALFRKINLGNTRKNAVGLETSGLQLSRFVQ